VSARCAGEESPTRVTDNRNFDLCYAIVNRKRVPVARFDTLIAPSA
jgi:hypothetical protein